MPFTIIRSDLCRVPADAIVNSANPEPTVGSGLDSAIYRAAGPERLLAARREIGRISPGQAAHTPAYALPARWIIHTVGPVWIDGSHRERETLHACYANTLALADSLGCGSIALPLISTGVYGFPKEEALQIALTEIRGFLQDHEMTVTLVVFDPSSFALSSALVGDIRAYIDEHGVSALSSLEYDGSPLADIAGASDIRPALSPDRRRPGFSVGAPSPMAVNAPEPKRKIRPFLRRRKKIETEQTSSFLPEEGSADQASMPGEAIPQQSPANVLNCGAPSFLPEEGSADQASMPAWADEAIPAMSPQTAPANAMEAFTAFGTPMDLEEWLSHTGDSFQKRLFQLIDDRGLDDVTVYKRANIDRKLFSRIRCNAGYRPTKKTAVAFAIALELDMPEMLDLLARAEIALSPSSKFDLIISYFVSHRIYDIYEINAALFDYGQPVLGP